MFAGDTHALLSGGGSLVGSLFQAQERIFKLYHAGVGEEQCSIICRHERTAGNNGMAFASKEVKKCATNLGRLHVKDPSSLHITYNILCSLRIEPGRLSNVRTFSSISFYFLVLPCYHTKQGGCFSYRSKIVQYDS